ncbi:efflux RND transporter periplasmic adaptor subunit [Lentzea tibetensis]|nr:efflux RND transporter periplasmic adaptor subunit [Lentzea tibetensis]
MSSKHLALLCALAAMAATACSASGPGETNPDLAPRGTTMTTVKPSRQDLTNKMSLTGKVTMNPMFGLVAPIAGQVRFFDVKAPSGTPTKPTRVATIWANGTPTYVEVPAGAVPGARLVDDKATVSAGMPIYSAKHGAYGIVADVAGDQAYKITDALAEVQAQIKNGPGPFPCAVLGTIAALPAGTVPEVPTPTEPKPGTDQPKQPGPPTQQQEQPKPTEPTGLRVVCTAPADVKLINGAAATLELVTGKAANALVVPVEAVAGTQGKGKVDVLKNGTRTTTDVVLGLTDGKVVEVKSGLNGDEELAVPGPNLPDGPQQNQDGVKPTGP